MLLARDRLGLDRPISSRASFTTSEKCFGFAIFTGYLFYAQLLVIWYGNLPEETRFVILRTKLDPWKPWAWVVLFMVFLIPFLTLLSKKIKIKRIPMILITLMILVGMWMERFLLVVPSLWRAEPASPWACWRSSSPRDFSAWSGSASRFFSPGPPLCRSRTPCFTDFWQEGEGTLKP